MRLRLLETADFRKNDATIWLEIESRNRELTETFQPDHVVAVRSGTGSQMMFLHRPVWLGSSWVFRSERLRLTNGTWNPLRLTDYANMVGLELVNLPTFDEILRRITRNL